MFFRLCILVLILTTSVCGASAQVAQQRMHPPHYFSPDSARYGESERNQRLYDSIRVKTSRRKVPRMLYRLLFVRPTLDTTTNGQIVDESKHLERYRNMRINTIDIEQLPVFDADGNWLERLGNKAHVMTRRRIIRRDLLFQTGDLLDPQLIVKNKQLLRSRKYISDVAIDVRPDPNDSTAVNLVVRTRDSWTITADAGIHSEGHTMIGLSDANIFGGGNQLMIKTHFNRKDFSYGGNIIEYEMPNLFGSFFSSELSAGRNFYNSILDFNLQKQLIKRTDYSVGVSYSDRKYKYYQLDCDTMTLVKEQNINVWGGNSRYLRHINSSLYFMWRYNRRRMSRRPQDVSALHHPAFHEHDALLLSMGLYREKFYTTSMIYELGANEYLASGYKAELLGGYSWTEFDNKLYLGLSLQGGGFCNAGYLMGGFTLGSYIDDQSGKWEQSAVDINLRWFSNLFQVRRLRIRQFLGMNYTQGWNRLTGSNEVIGFTRYNGLQMLKGRHLGTNRMTMNTETIIFTPYQPLGFRIAFFTFADFGLLGTSSNIFRNNFFTSFGAGVRIKNERLIFSTIQIQLGLALGKGGIQECDYFRISNASRLEQYRYNPTRPELVGFK